jgi:hypothetical protein
MRVEDLAEIVATDLAQGGMRRGGDPGPEDDHITWEQYVDDMWEDRDRMFDEFPLGLSFISWRALVRQVASELGLVP